VIGSPVSRAAVVRSRVPGPDHLAQVAAQAPGCYPVSHQGTSPATTLGAINRKAAVLAMIVIFRIGLHPAAGRALLTAAEPLLV
jgi:hypothetical protein